MMNEKIYQLIYNQIEPLLPTIWEELVIYIEYGKASYTMSFYVGSKGNMVQCYDLTNVSEDKILKNFEKIDKIISEERNNNKETWSNMTIVVHENKFKADFDYTDLSKGSYKYKKEWKNKYL